MKKQNCIVEFYLNQPLKNGSIVVVDGSAILNEMNRDNVEVVTHYNIPTKYIKFITVSFKEGFNVQIVVSSGKNKIVSKKRVIYDFVPPKMEYGGITFENTGVEKHIRLHKNKRGTKEENCYD